MIDITTPRGRLIDASLKLAAEKPWSDVTMIEIGERAGMTLDEVRKSAGSKSQILAQFMRTVDDAVLKAARSPVAGESKRDQLFEVVMARFDALMPYKPALKSIQKAGAADATLVMPFLNAQRWMLAAAGIGTDGASGLVRTVGLGSLYMSVFQTWLDDEDPGMARTMAALDRRLRRAESTIQSVDGFADGVGRIANDVSAVGRQVLSGIFSAGGGRRAGQSDTAGEGGRSDVPPASPSTAASGEPPVGSTPQF